jgi:hypothetical protein
MDRKYWNVGLSNDTCRVLHFFTFDPNSIGRTVMADDRVGLAIQSGRRKVGWCNHNQERVGETERQKDENESCGSRSPCN